ncbi:MAG: ROK family transcriptional regulator [Bacillota bacterium]|nr:ROK family transcriptional regulator [Bacillota bacterium]
MIEGEHIVSKVRILRLIKENGPVSRVQLQHMLGLSFPAVAAAVTELLSDGLITPAGTVSGGLGRKAELLEFNTRKGHVVGIDVGARKIRLAVANLAGNILQRAEIPTLAYEGGPRVMDRLVTLLESVLEADNISESELLAVGVGAPGISEEKTEVNLLFPFIPSWEGVPIRSTLERRFGVPVLVENDVDVAVIGERTWGAGRGCDNLVFVNVAVGAAAGIILDGKLHRGARRAAGEIGFMVVDRSLVRDSFSDQGALEDAITGPGIVRRFKARLGLEPDRPVPLPTSGPPSGPAAAPEGVQLEVADAEAVFALAGTGHRVAQEVIDETVSYLAMALSNLIAVLDPEMVVLGGGVGLALHSSAGERIVEFIARHVPFVPRIVPAKLGNDAGVFGAIAVALEKAQERLERSLASSAPARSQSCSCSASGASSGSD